MLAAALTNNDSKAPAVVSQSQAVSWDELSDRIAKLADIWQELRSQRVGLCLPANADGIAALAALDKVQAHVYLIDEHTSNDAIAELTGRFKLIRILRADGKSERRWQLTSFEHNDESNSIHAQSVDCSAEPSSTDSLSTVTVLTSGTEGIPKAATYTWAQLAKPVRILDASPKASSKETNVDVWLLTFRIHLYAGLQVMLQALLNQQTVVIPGSQAEPDEVLKLIVEQQVTCASATPSYWRRLALFGDRSLFSAAPLRQITLGGELADQPILDTLRATFPQARLSHIYATTELGRCFAVTDGLAGFPTSYLADDGERPSQVDAQLRIEEGELFVRSVNGTERICGSGGSSDADANPTRTASECADAWIATGDLIEVVGDRVLFAGRAGDMINVGGNKVRPAMVESIIRGVPGVADVRVFGKESSIAGQLVACEIVVTSNSDPAEVKARVQAACREALTPYQAPRSIDAVSKLELSQAGKMLRR